MNPSAKVMEIKTKINKCDLIKCKSFCAAKEPWTKAARTSLLAQGPRPWYRGCRFDPWLGRGTETHMLWGLAKRQNIHEKTSHKTGENGWQVMRLTRDQAAFRFSSSFQKQCLPASSSTSPLLSLLRVRLSSSAMTAFTRLCSNEASLPACLTGSELHWFICNSENFLCWNFCLFA